MGCTAAEHVYHRSFGPLNSPEYGEEDRLTSPEAAALLARSREPDMTAEPGSWWLDLLGRLAETMGGTVEPEETPRGGLTMVLTLLAVLSPPAAPRAFLCLPFCRRHQAAA